MKNAASGPPCQESRSKKKDTNNTERHYYARASPWEAAPSQGHRGAPLARHSARSAPVIFCFFVYLIIRELRGFEDEIIGPFCRGQNVGFPPGACCAAAGKKVRLRRGRNQLALGAQVVHSTRIFLIEEVVLVMKRSTRFDRGTGVAAHVNSRPSVVGHLVKTAVREARDETTIPH